MVPRLGQAARHAARPHGALLAEQRAASVFHQEDQVQVIGRTRQEFRDEVKGEVPCCWRFGMDEQTTADDVFAEADQANDGIREEASTQPLSFVVFVDAETSQEGDRLRVPACSFAESRGSGLKANLGHAPGVVGHNVSAAVRRDDEDPG